MRNLGSVPPSRRRWRRTLRSGLFWTALGLGAASISYALNADVAARSLGFDRTLATIFFGLVPVPALALGVHGLALALRLRAASDLADRTATYLIEHLPEGYVVVPHYRPRDGRDEEVAAMVIGPRGIVVIEPRPEPGAVFCEEDHWYARRKYGVGRRIPGMSPSQRARWNAARVRTDIASDGIIHTPVEPLVAFTIARVENGAGSSVPVVQGFDGIVERLIHGRDFAPVRPRPAAEGVAEPAGLAAV